MGIKGLRTFLKKEFKDESLEERVPFNYFANKVIAVDASIYICKFKVVYKDFFEEALINFIVSLLESKIIPVFIFDGNAPEEKTNEKRKRAEKKKANISRIEKLENDLKIYLDTKIISDDLREINSKVYQSKLSLNAFCVDRVSDYVTKLRSNIFELNNQDFEILKELLTVFGIQYFTAQGEGELLCSKLVKNGLADAVLTEDTDVLASGSHVMLCDANLKLKEFTLIKLEKILEKLDLNQESFLDFCIMLGTDFNENIPRVGPVKSLKYIKEYSSLENVEKQIDVSCLSYQRTRKIFTDEEEFELKLVSKNVDYEKLEKRVLENRLRTSLDNIKFRLI
jgi:5'-3' exonuclease